MNVILLIVAVVLFIVGAILGFGAFGSSATIGDIVAIVSLGLACFAGSFLVPAVAGWRSP